MQDIRRLRPIWLVASLALCGSVSAQIHLVSDDIRRAALEDEARIERTVMAPMRDGRRLASRIYIPQNATGPVPAVFWRTPYNFSELNEGDPSRPSAYLKFALDAIQHGKEADSDLIVHDPSNPVPSLAGNLWRS